MLAILCSTVQFLCDIDIHVHTMYVCHNLDGE